MAEVEARAGGGRGRGRLWGFSGDGGAGREAKGGDAGWLVVGGVSDAFSWDLAQDMDDAARAYRGFGLASSWLGALGGGRACLVSSAAVVAEIPLVLALAVDAPERPLGRSGLCLLSSDGVIGGVPFGVFIRSRCFSSFLRAQSSRSRASLAWYSSKNVEARTWRFAGISPGARRV